MKSRKIFCFFTLILLTGYLSAQVNTTAPELSFYFKPDFTERFQLMSRQLVDSIERMKNKANRPEFDDTTRIKLLHSIAVPYIEVDNDSSLKYALKARKLAQHAHIIREVARINDFLGALYTRMGNSTESLECLIKAREVFLLNADSTRLIIVGRNLGGLYISQGDTVLAKHYLKNALSITPRSTYDSQFHSWALMDLGEVYLKSNNLDSAMFFSRASVDISDNASFMKKYTPNVLHNMGLIMQRKGDTVSAFDFMKKALHAAYMHNNYQSSGRIFMSIAELYDAKHIPDTAFMFTILANKVANDLRIGDLLETTCFRLKEYYKAKNNPDSAFYYSERLSEAIISNRNIESAKQTQTITFRETLKEQQHRAEAEKARARIIYFSLAAVLGIALISGFFLYRGYQMQKQTNASLQKQKEKIQSTLELLKSTQSQLIQSEKMASLGELTAGIAHEIQNPLNFVNNFSEVNQDLLKDLKTEMKSGNLKEADQIADDLISNEEKISHHGKRADAIVKGMMQHSRGETGVKEPTDINLLAEEYMRLAYHARLNDAVGQGQKAKVPQGAENKSNSTGQSLINVRLEKELDPNVGKVSVVPQDIGRVLFNLFNNAYYAVAEKHQKHPDGYQPTVRLNTSRVDNEVRIMIQDNGSGIPSQIIDKIFQPFFTTKPTGQGTGLGLSLAYDIIKAHGGEIKVKSTEGEGSEFMITLNTNT